MAKGNAETRQKNALRKELVDRAEKLQQEEDQLQKDEKDLQVQFQKLHTQQQVMHSRRQKLRQQQHQLEQELQEHMPEKLMEIQKKQKQELLDQNRKRDLLKFDLQMEEPPIPPAEGFIGTKSQGYILDSRHVFQPPDPGFTNDNPDAKKPDFENVFYYQGRLIQKNGYENVTFIAFSDEALALSMTECPSHKPCPSHEPHLRALCPKYYGFDKKVRRHLVRFPRFDGFLLEDNQRAFLSSLRERSTDILGHPGAKGATEAREVANGLASCHQEGWTCSLMNLGIGLVVCGDKVKFILNQCRGGLNKTDWNKKLSKNIDYFKEALESDPLEDENENWGERTSFFKCFEKINLLLDPQLKMITEHRFFKVDIKSIMEPFDKVQHGIYTRDGGSLRIRVLSEAITAGEFDCFLNKIEYNDKDEEVFVWTVDGDEFSPGLLKIYTHNDNNLYCNRRSVKGLLKFIRHAFQHYADHQLLSLHDLYTEIETHWPGFIDRVHERLYS